MLKLERIVKSFDGINILNNLSLEIPKGQIVSILGPSGSGKTTLLNLILGISEVDSGRIIFENEDLTYVPMEKRGFNIVFQDYALFPNLNAYENITYGLKNKPDISTKEEVDELIHLLGLEKHLDKKIDQLSGGQKQRVALARTMVMKPKILLLDEPFAAIDAKVRQELRSWLREMITRVGITSIFVTHDQDEAIEVADEIIITNHGHIEQAGTPIEIYSQPKTPFVTEFMGSPTRISNITSFHGYEELGEGLHAVVRPEHVSVTKKTEQSRFSSSVEEGVVERVMFRGREVELHVRVHDVLLVANRRLEEASITEGERVNVFIYQVFAFPAGENGTQNVNIVENANIETEKLFYI